MDNAAAIRAHVKAFRYEHPRPATIKHRRSSLERMAGVLPVDLLDATEAHLHDWQDGLTRRGLAPESVRAYTCHARMFYRWAARTGLIETDPSLDVRPPKVGPGRAKPIGEDDLRIAIATAPEPVKTWLILAAFLGLRAGEIARVCRDDIGEDTLHVPEGKGGRSRTVPLPGVVREALAGFTRSDQVRVFITSEGTPVTPHWVSVRCSEHLHSVCGPEVTLHKLRHRFAKQLFRLSKDVRLVQELLGHASLATTQVYLEVSAEHGRAMTERLARTLRRGNARRSSSSTPRPTSARDTPRAGWATPHEGAA